MDPFRELGRTLLMLGMFILLVGTFFYFGGKLPFRLGRLPGDIVHKGEHTTFYFPIVTCLVLSVGLSLLFWLLWLSSLRRESCYCGFTAVRNLSGGLDERFCESHRAIE